MAFRKGKQKPNCSITFSYRRKRQVVLGRKAGRLNPTSSGDCSIFSTTATTAESLLQPRSHLGFISRYVALSPLLHLFIPSLFNLSLSSSLHLFRSVPFLSLSSSHPKNAPSAPLLRSPLLHFFIQSLFNLSLSPSLHLSRSLSFPFPSLFISPPENYPFCSSLLLNFFFFI